MRLDARMPVRLDGSDMLIRVAAGYADVFAVSTHTDTPAMRRHVLRAEAGDLIFGLPRMPDDAAMEIIAVGGQSCEAVVIPRDLIAEIDRGDIELWLVRLNGALDGPGVDTLARDAMPLDELWAALDQLHFDAASGLSVRLQALAAAESEALRQKARRSAIDRDGLFRTLAGIFTPTVAEVSPADD